MFEIAIRTGLGPLAGERKVFRAGKNLQLINARLAGAAAGDGETHESRLDGGEGLDVVLGCYRWAFAAGRHELGQLCFQFAATFSHCSGLGFVRIRKRQVSVGEFHTLKDALERVVIVLRNGIELVIVTTRAAGGETEENRAGGVDDVVQLIRALHAVELAVLSLYNVVRTGYEEAGGERFAQRIARELLAHKPVVRLVFIERADHPVAVRPRVVAFAAGFKAMRFAKAHQVQPMRRPALSITRTGEHTIHQPHESAGLVVL